MQTGAETVLAGEGAETETLGGYEDLKKRWARHRGDRAHA